MPELSNVLALDMQDQLSAPRFHVNSVKLIAEAASIPEPSIEAATLLSDDLTLRLRQIITRASKFMEHSNRDKLTCADVNKSLRWSDCRPIFGYECDTNDRAQYSYSAEAQIFKYDDETVDLIEKYQKATSDVTDILTSERRHEAKPELTIEPLAIEHAMECDVLE